MPELPEVESLRLSLLPICGERISALSLSKLAPVETVSSKAVVRQLSGQTIRGLARWGKYLLLQVENGIALVVHLGMSGKFLLRPKPLTALEKHTHLVLKLASGSEVHFVDPRRFGTLSLSAQADGQDNAFLRRLGPDFLDSTLTVDTFIQRARRHPKLSLKSLSLNQNVAAGLGNIYACEALYRARLNPERWVESCSDRQLERFFTGAREILQLAIEQGGTTFRDYLNGLGHRGLMKEFLQVYDREGQLSLDGRGQVVRIVQNGRSTWYCPSLQK